MLGVQEHQGEIVTPTEVGGKDYDVEGVLQDRVVFSGLKLDKLQKEVCVRFFPAPVASED